MPVDSRRVARVCLWHRPEKKARSVPRRKPVRLTSSRFQVDRVPIRAAMFFGGGEPKRYRWFLRMHWDHLLRGGRSSGRIYVTVTD